MKILPEYRLIILTFEKHLILSKTQLTIVEGENMKLRYYLVRLHRVILYTLLLKISKNVTLLSATINAV